MGNSPKETSVVPGISVTILKLENAEMVGVLVYTTRTVDIEF